MDSDSFEMPRNMVKLAGDGTNYRYWALRLRFYLIALDLWGHITGEAACPPAPVPPPPEPTAAAAKDVPDDVSKASNDYKCARDAYDQWKAHDAHIKLVLLDTVEDSLILSLPTESAQMAWTYLEKRFKPILEAMHYTSLQKLQELRQYNGESVDAFFKRFMDIWHKLEPLAPLSDVCGACTCCKRHKEQNDKRCLYEFLIHVSPEFAPFRDLLLFRNPQATVYNALNELRVAEIQLQSIQCSRCGNYGHTSQKCTMRKNCRGGRSKKGSSLQS